MVTKRIPILLLTGYIMGMASCVADVSLDAGEEPQVVVECVLSEEPVQTLYLSYTKGASREVAPDLPEAVLSDLTEGKEAGYFVRTANGSWQLAYSAIPEHRYRLDVTVPGHEPIWAEQTMPNIPPVESVVLERDESYRYPGYEAAEGILYYSSFPCAVWSYGLNYDLTTKKHVPAEQLCTDCPSVDNFNLTGETFVHESVFPYPDGQALRFYSVLSGTASIHRRFLRFPKSNSSSQQYFVVEGLLGLEYYDDISRDPLPTECVLFFAALSDEYDQYLRDALYHQQAQETTDISALYHRTNLFTNIQGGLGIFGAATKMPIRWSGVFRSELVPQDRIIN